MVSGCPSQMRGFAPVFEVALSFCFSAEKPGMMFKLGAPVFRASLDCSVGWMWSLRFAT